MKKTLLTALLVANSAALAAGYTKKVSQGATVASHVTQHQTSEDTNTSEDPLEGFNRTMFNFNEFLDKHFLKPVSTLYSKIMPHPLQHGIRNMYNNLSDVPTIANDVLQTNFYQASLDAWRFAVNSTVGLAGFYDPASDIGLESNYEDFGLTMAHWGWTDSTYVVLPFFGPSTLRDGLGMPVDYYGFSVYSRIQDAKTRNVLYALGIISQRAELLQYQDVYEQIAIDQYAFIRNAYLQKRAAEIQRNKELSDPYYNTVYGNNTAAVSGNTEEDEDAAFAGGSPASTTSSTTSNNTDSNMDAAFAASAYQ